MGAAGYRPYRTAPGWGSLPIEAMVRRPPDLVFRAFLDSPRYRQDHLTASRPPVVALATRRARQVAVPGPGLPCGTSLMVTTRTRATGPGRRTEAATSPGS